MKSETRLNIRILRSLKGKAERIAKSRHITVTDLITECIQQMPEPSPDALSVDAIDNLRRYFPVEPITINLNRDYDDPSWKTWVISVTIKNSEHDQGMQQLEKFDTEWGCQNLPCYACVDLQFVD